MIQSTGSDAITHAMLGAQTLFLGTSISSTWYSVLCSLYGTYSEAPGGPSGKPHLARRLNYLVDVD